MTTDDLPPEVPASQGTSPLPVRWRIEDLEVQMHLGAVEASDKANAQLSKLRDRWADARRQFEDSIKTASSVADTVRTGLEKAFNDLRQALLESKNKLTSSPSD